ncbi:MAG: hypothetical protein II013_05785 [Lachnobacterium sp.]|nr:hypothetical protein [Lachnobacterium sp.]
MEKKIEKIKKSLLVMFPGVGYTCDKPLLYYIGKLYQNDNFEIKKLSYTGFMNGLKDDSQKMNHAYELVKKQTKEQLKDINWNEYEKVVFVSKSIGTVGAAYIFKYMQDKKIINSNLKISNIFLTPLVETFNYVTEKSGFVIIGDKDQWSDYAQICKLAKKYNLPVHIIENANHSLENSNIFDNIDIISNVVKIVDSYR